MKYVYLICLLVANLLLGLYSSGRLDPILATQPQPPTVSNAPEVLQPTATTPLSTTTGVTSSETVPPVSTDNQTGTATASTSTLDTTTAISNADKNAASVSSGGLNTPHIMPSHNNASSPQTSQSASTQAPKTATAVSASPAKSPTPTAAPTPAAPQILAPPQAPPQVRVETPPASQTSSTNSDDNDIIRRHQPNKRIAAMCQNSAGAWLPCR